MLHIILISATLVQPEIIVGLLDQLENETNPTLFTCQATGEPVPTISWHYWGVNVTTNVSTSSKYGINHRQINRTTVEEILEITNASSYDVGTYVCTASNGLGSVRSVAVLTINGEKNVLPCC